MTSFRNPKASHDVTVRAVPWEAVYRLASSSAVRPRARLVAVNGNVRKMGLAVFATTFFVTGSVLRLAQASYWTRLADSSR